MNQQPKFRATHTRNHDGKRVQQTHRRRFGGQPHVVARDEQGMTFIIPERELTRI